MELQRGLRDLIFDREVTTGSAYLRSVAGAPELKLIREIRVFWQLLNLERFCPLSGQLLKRLGAYESMVDAYAAHDAVPQYRQELGPHFLAFLAGHGQEPLIRSVAGFELALLAAKRGEPGERAIGWPAHPYEVLGALLSGGDLQARAGRYETRVSAQIEGFFTVADLGGAPAPSQSATASVRSTTASE